MAPVRDRDVALRRDDAGVGFAQPEHVHEDEPDDGADGEEQGEADDPAGRHGGDRGDVARVRTRNLLLCEPSVTARVVLVMGVAGAGKTTVGRALADALGWAFEDADAYHDAASLAKIGRGEGLTDADRAPWLARLGRLVRQRAEGGPPMVLACSALKAAYRDILGADRPDVVLVWLDVPEAVLAARLAERQGHVAGLDLLPSQLATLEPPTGALSLDGTMPVEALVEAVRQSLRAR